MRILLVEDDTPLAQTLARGLREKAYAVGVVGDGDAAVYQAAIYPYDALVLDVLLPKRSGFDVCRELRRRGNRARVLMLTSRDTVEDRVQGLDLGADDYLTKPFAFPELLARLRAAPRAAAAWRGGAARRPPGRGPGDRHAGAAGHARRGGRRTESGGAATDAGRSGKILITMCDPGVWSCTRSEFSSLSGPQPHCR